MGDSVTHVWGTCVLTWGKVAEAAPATTHLVCDLPENRQPTGGVCCGVPHAFV